MTKAEIIRRGVALGLDYSLTHSCYDPAPRRRVRTLRQLRSARGGIRGGRPCAIRRFGACAAMTERIYYTEPARRSFDAVVTAVIDHEGAPAVVLDRTAFYPTSGGQPFDTGHLGTTDVVNAIDDGEVCCTS